MFSILTYNCNQGKGNVENLCKIINKSETDIICLQEFTSKIKDKLKLNGYVLVEPSGKQGWFRNVIYTRLERNLEVSFLKLSTMIRQVPVIKFRYQNKMVTVANIHLSSGLEKAEVRKGEMSEIFNKIGNANKLIIVGDFNMRENEVVGRMRFCDLVGTYCSNNPMNDGNKKFNIPFDRFLYKGVEPVGSTICIGNKSRKENTTPSDHYGLISKFEINNNNSTGCTLL